MYGAPDLLAQTRHLLRPDHRALEARVNRLVAAGQSRIPRDRVRILRTDANGVLDLVLSDYHQRDYLWVFADLEAPKQFPFSSIETLRRRGHSSIDLYLLFPLEMGILRLTAYDRRELDRYASTLTAFFGTDEWRRIVERRTASAAERIQSTGGRSDRRSVGQWVGRSVGLTQKRHPARRDRPAKGPRLNCYPSFGPFACAQGDNRPPVRLSACPPAALLDRLMKPHHAEPDQPDREPGEC